MNMCQTTDKYYLTRSIHGIPDYLYQSHFMTEKEAVDLKQQCDSESIEYTVNCYKKKETAYYSDLD